MHILNYLYNNKIIPYSIHSKVILNSYKRKLLCYKKVNSNYSRFLFLHNRKTGGTSFNEGLSKFFNYSNKDIDQFLDINRGNYFIKDFSIFMGGNLDLINKNEFHIATTHLPAHALNIKDDTFTFTILREPVERFISHYKMLKQMIECNSNHGCLKEERFYYDDCIVKCALKMPINHRHAQLFSFSKEMNIKSAINRLNNLTIFDTIENYNFCIKYINEEFKWKIPVLHSRKGCQVILAPKKILQLKDIFQDEISFYNQSLELSNRCSSLDDRSI